MTFPTSDLNQKLKVRTQSENLPLSGLGYRIWEAGIWLISKMNSPVPQVLLIPFILPPLAHYEPQSFTLNTTDTLERT